MMRRLNPISRRSGRTSPAPLLCLLAAAAGAFGLPAEMRAEGQDYIFARVIHVPSPDSDNDGLVDATEAWMGTARLDPDTDDDGLLDGEEVFTHDTDPLDWDTDGDTMNDGWEVAGLLDPKDDTGENGALGDPDEDTFINRDEHEADTLPRDPSSLLVVTEINANPAGATVNWIGGVHATQYLEAVDALAPTGLAWQILYTNLPPTPIHNAVVHPGPLSPARAYRIKADR